MKIGFIGLGNMGAPMALNLLKAGHAVNVFDLNAQAVQALVDAGAKAAGSPKAAVTDVEYVITMLPAAAHVRSVLTADDGIFAGVAKGVTIIDSSTIDPASVKAFAELAAATRQYLRRCARVGRHRRRGGGHADLHGRRQRSAC